MELGAFSVSLAVKDINASRAFYEKLGFTEFGGNLAHNYLIMKNGPHVIGLFQGMFEGNVLTFNPGWDQDCNSLSSFTDVRDIESALKDGGVTLTKSTQPGTTGPESIAVLDPDGNAILIDQHL
ncbi:VOC family protein [Alteromonas gilva]|uniref:VOC family protein n=1 Tax=Alteromonas gilva TaxID=2987522 RepID=A0ABT5L691_9ALTE|nr:VOC family protein [Alteromonas gilva]MDC8832393.1 VOC family protein [Alteromonas gilva]